MADIARLVLETTSEDALRAAAGLPELLEHALANPHLPSQLWFEKYPNAKVKAATAKVLARRPLDGERKAHLLKVETRAGVVAAMFEENIPTLEDFNALLTSKALTKVLATSITNTWPDIVDVAWLTAAGAKVGGDARLEAWLRDPAAFTDAEIIDALRDYDAWGETWDTEHRLPWLLATRPAVLPGAVRSTSHKLRTQAAGCRHLTSTELQVAVGELDTFDAAHLPTHAWVAEREFTLMALAHNPVVPVEIAARIDPVLRARASDDSRSQSAAQRMASHPGHLVNAFEDEDDPFKREWILKRVRPRAASGDQAYSRAKTRNHDLVAFMANPHLTHGEVSMLVHAIKDVAFILNDPRVNAPYVTMLRRHPLVAEQNTIDVDEVAAALTPIERTPKPRAPRWWPDVRENTHLIATNALGMDPASMTYLEENLESVAAWQFAFTQVLSGQFHGTIADLVMTSNLATL